MSVLRLAPYLEADPIDEVAAFYQEVLGFDVGFHEPPRIVTQVGRAGATPEIIILTDEIIPGAPIPHLLVEVDDIDQTYERAVAGGHQIVYPLTDEVWGVRRFFVTDPRGRIINVLGHNPV